MPFCPEKKFRTKKMSERKNYPDQKITGQKNCTVKKIVQTKKLSGQKNCPAKKIVRIKKWSRQILFVCISNALGLFSVHLALDFLSWVIFVHIFVRKFNKGMVLYFRNILQFLRNIMGLLGQVIKHSTQNCIS